MTVALRNALIVMAILLFSIIGECESSLAEATGNPLFVELQQFRQEQYFLIDNGSLLDMSLINLNANINDQYIFVLRRKNAPTELYNIYSGKGQKLTLNKEDRILRIEDVDGNVQTCDIVTKIIIPIKTINSNKDRHPFIPVCDGQLSVRTKQNGYQPKIEKGAETVRSWMGDFGETVVNSVKETVFSDRYLDKAEITKTSDADLSANTFLPDVLVDESFADSTLNAEKLGFVTDSGTKNFQVGKWYSLKNFRGAFASVIMPEAVSKTVLATHKDRVNNFDGVENKALVFLVALDLRHYTLGWSHGTDLPGVGWSKRSVYIEKGTAKGPDGIDSISPMERPGHVPPVLWERTIGTISGGFQLRHSAFQYGPLSKTNNAHHYGFMEDGVVLASMSPGLASIVVGIDGDVDIKSWTDEDNKNISKMRFIRQNGVPIIERDENGVGIPGKSVKSWGDGNWSGSAEGELRAPRGAACIIEKDNKKFLVYAYFTGVTPSAMARVFQAYGCNYAIHLDMNSPGQAYASLFRPNGETFDIEYLNSDMNGVDPSKGIPRYLAVPDYRDFFYILKK